MALDVGMELLDQLAWHWDHQARPRLDGLTDAEYFWEPAEGCWNVRHRGTSHAPMAVGSGAFTIDFARPEPSPAPVTTIAWRLGHLLVGVLGARNAAHFGAPPVTYQEFDYPGTADGALDLLDEYYARWIRGVRSLGGAGLDRACGPAEGPYSERTMAALVLHINREMIHHLAEVALLRDLFAHRQ
ncbi:DinB family protein [Arthrobacter sp. I2-34]|uniref:DinB family protein n=1 Tax=Arthrobacter hankyongi TaxID=2904801 RepID=A0ABS9LBB4_9MICC|nr:DinB family protein [Arthrobacter hankyongi]MCG2623974.1 DinB family protein [Arthrobacter hankyongi]